MVLTLLWKTFLVNYAFFDVYAIKLEKVIYTFYLCYLQNDINQNKYFDRKWNSTSFVFIGTMVSNKIKLLVR